MKLNTIYTIIAAFLLNSCATRDLAISWKAPNTIPRTFSKIMVVGVFKTPDTALRRKLETSIVNDLKDLGYNAVSMVEEYGPKGLANLDQEATYLKLCDRGIDAIITIALLDKTKVNGKPNSSAKQYAALYYYNHIWNYRNTQADLTDTSRHSAQEKRFLLESILFDLQLLEPLYIAATKPFNRNLFSSVQQDYGKAVMKSMLKRKVIKKQPKRTITPA